MAFVIKMDGEITTWPPPGNGTDYQLDEISPAIGGGYIEVLHLGRGMLMVIDEDGKHKFGPLAGGGINRVATAMVISYPRGIFEGDFIVGDVLICEEGQIT